jgi:hypothetical protein
MAIDTASFGGHEPRITIAVGGKTETIVLMRDPRLEDSVGTIESTGAELLRVIDDMLKG